MCVVRSLCVIVQKLIKILIKMNEFGVWYQLGVVS